MTWVSLRGKPETTLAMQDFHVPLVWHKFFSVALIMNAMSNDIQASSVRRFFHSNSHTFMSTIWWWIQLLTRPNLCDLICEVSNQGEKNWTVIELICLHTTKCTHLVVSHFSLSVLLLEKSFVILGCLWFLGSHKMLVLGIHIPQRDGNPWWLHKKGDGNHTKQRLWTYKVFTSYPNPPNTLQTLV
jgi:hypothetical protein